MAFDSVSKRLSILNLGSSSPRTLPWADGTIDQGDRQHFICLYSGVLAEEPALLTPRKNFITSAKVLNFTSKSRVINFDTSARISSYTTRSD